jgi:hypothetical protein
MSDASLSKLDVARRQLVTAIRLFLHLGDPVSIYTLAANAWEIVDALCCLRDVESLSQEARENIESSKNLKRDFVNTPFRNFFKHADHDPEEMIEGFSAERCDSVIYLAVEDYIRLEQKSPIEFQVFQLWYLSVHIDKVAPDDAASYLEASERIFPGIRELPREQRVSMGAKVLEDARKNNAVMSDPRTERLLSSLTTPNKMA